MNTNNTPEADKAERMAYSGEYMVPTEVARKLEQERDEAREELSDIRLNLGADAEGYTLLHAVCAIQNERDEARAELAEWTDSAKNVRKEYDDEHHCSCVAILRKLLKDAERKRDEWAAMCGRYKQERDEQLKDLEK